jgi:UDP-N-acetylmuramate--alanine ligase
MDVKNKRIHFMGVAGIGMSAIAEIAARRGAAVTGCDIAANDNSERLTAAGILCLLGHGPAHLRERPDLLVYSSAVPPDNAELAAARAAGIEVISRSNMLARLMAAKRGIGISGAHGKTTTTWLAAKLLLEAGLDPTVMVGGVVPALGSNFRSGAGDWFVTEVDESDGLLLEIRPTISIITNIDSDHLDHYTGGIDQIEATFAQYAGNTRPDGCIIGCADDVRVRRVVTGAGRQALGYGFSERADVRGVNVRLNGIGSTFDAEIAGRTIADLRVTLLGRHNVLNALAVVALAERLGVGEEVLRRALGEARAVKRRLEKRGEAGGIAVYDDYGHHPTEIAATLAAAKLLAAGRGRLVVVFQPHRYSRTAHLLKEFGKCFGGADHVVVTSIYSANEPPIAGVSSAQVVEEVVRSGHPSVQYIPAWSSIVPHLVSVVKAGDLVLLLGAGDVWKLSDELLKRF